MTIYLKVVSKDENHSYPDDFLEKVDEFDWGNYQVLKVDEPFGLQEHEIVDILLERGITALIEDNDSINEQLVRQNETTDKIVKFMHRFLDKVGIDNELIIVDPYFFPDNAPNDYVKLMVDIISKYISSLTTLKVITKSSYNNAVKTIFKTKLTNLKPTLVIEHKHSNDFHDRFWISNNRKKGIITGTSLNGLGNKYALIDRLKITDVREIVTVLNNGSLI